ncbi:MULTISPECIES: lasso peptide biosynthesis B2 protein [Amycolatopsis]|uniref:Lasso peptide biosynthesis B2 protein n=1 Tax=Amycolatopsis dendrobii TaxID=2760662 RepID=A0A7W3VT00_9PSEU|nr:MULTISPECIES: lasso peptide biosynthesis B2 protein [Amycolatopsis]MBB1152649.1 lasso peptide biosynthesis B2 protein [Amycolatopsis dendrobii]UKD52170.1 lasso peptide biosynthesis B2 protein [Amycolatopsis sp. FU40]
MSQPTVVPHRIRLPLHRKLLPLLIVGLATVLTALSPKHLCAILRFARRGARPATFEQARFARRSVVAISLRCAGDGCLLRSVAAALLCRVHGTWPTWRTGVRTQPFSAHAWIEADGQVVDEIHPAGYFAPLLTVAPLRTARNDRHRP